MTRLARALWQLTGPLRRPLQRRLERFLARCLAQALKTHDPAWAVTDEVTLVLDAVVAEQFRLQEQIDDLQVRGHVKPQGKEAREFRPSMLHRHLPQRRFRITGID